ncbi:MAG: hypothetical protein IPP74_09425 [Alphaproteobacteria bacterium]|nr:hypothetical protein [Alphaproteobacteria bacterium]
MSKNSYSLFNPSWENPENQQYITESTYKNPFSTESAKKANKVVRSLKGSFKSKVNHGKIFDDNHWIDRTPNGSIQLVICQKHAELVQQDIQVRFDQGSVTLIFNDVKKAARFYRTLEMQEAASFIIPLVEYDETSRQYSFQLIINPASTEHFLKNYLGFDTRFVNLLRDVSYCQRMYAKGRKLEIKVSSKKNPSHTKISQTAADIANHPAFKTQSTQAHKQHLHMATAFTQFGCFNGVEEIGVLSKFSHDISDTFIHPKLLTVFEFKANGSKGIIEKLGDLPLSHALIILENFLLKQSVKNDTVLELINNIQQYLISTDPKQMLSDKNNELCTFSATPRTTLKKSYSQEEGELGKHLKELKTLFEKHIISDMADILQCQHTHDIISAYNNLCTINIDDAVEILRLTQSNDMEPRKNAVSDLEYSFQKKVTANIKEVTTINLRQLFSQYLGLPTIAHMQHPAVGKLRNENNPQDSFDKCLEILFFEPLLSTRDFPSLFKLVSEYKEAYPKIQEGWTKRNINIFPPDDDGRTYKLTYEKLSNMPLKLILIPEASKNEYNALLETFKNIEISDPFIASSRNQTIIVNQNNEIISGLNRFALLVHNKQEEAKTVLQQHQSHIEIIEARENRKHFYDAKNVILRPTQGERLRYLKNLTKVYKLESGDDMRIIIPVDFVEKVCPGTIDTYLKKTVDKYLVNLKDPSKIAKDIPVNDKKVVLQRDTCKDELIYSFTHAIFPHIEFGSLGKLSLKVQTQIMKDYEFALLRERAAELNARENRPHQKQLAFNDTVDFQIQCLSQEVEYQNQPMVVTLNETLDLGKEVNDQWVTSVNRDFSLKKYEQAIEQLSNKTNNIVVPYQFIIRLKNKGEGAEKARSELINFFRETFGQEGRNITITIPQIGNNMPEKTKFRGMSYVCLTLGNFESVCEKMKKDPKEMLQEAQKHVCEQHQKERWESRGNRSV